MIEKLVSLAFPPGYWNNGTAFQAKDRWHTGNLVRFFQGTIQPVGGWTTRTVDPDSEAAMSGVPNAMVSWTLEPPHIAIGTTTGLFIVSEVNPGLAFVYDATPIDLVGGGPFTWQLAVFGSALTAVASVTALDDTAPVNTYFWKYGMGRAEAAFTSANGPHSVFGVCTTPERFFVLLRGADPDDVTSHLSPGDHAILD